MTSTASAGLEVAGLDKTFGDLAALTDMTFDVAPGEVFGFVGSNGAGKSTTMRIILGVLAADRGEVRFGGSLINSDTRRRIGYMPEERGLYPKMKVGPQLVYLARLHGLSGSEAAERTAYWTDRLGIASRVDDDVAALSLGNQQRVQLAAALVFDPDLLVLDEPFSGLDPVAVDVMSEVIVEKAADGVPVLFSSHQLELVQRLCDRVGIIAKGRMRALGAVDELRSAGGLRLRIDAPRAPAGWADGIAGVLSADYADTTVLRVDGAHDDQAILSAALATGPVHGFVSETPDLTELFREVVTAV
ncbi:ABC-2 type transport system ATP-binding protein [Gordonia malaquae]|uniref:Putative ABC transporter ATP-binding protein n=1 Tax=Gordonia malaquae NBRC 108250 TaxID=1223542 RepID=M3THN0_GORML|nr:ATP-binding cassette domain-containing protein [Gordonia malaquae]GAC81006.1 putative ABC transporter ATP-binding protein [Gordonia malaquae NBRC 108250]SEE39472.1 ABC-2 type transport system ATP-binding protein [Gordonia malaquae]